MTLKIKKLAQALHAQDGTRENGLPCEFCQSLLHACHRALSQHKHIHLIGNSCGSLGYQSVVGFSIAALSGGKGTISQSIYQ